MFEITTKDLVLGIAGRTKDIPTAIRVILGCRQSAGLCEGCAGRYPQGRRRLASQV